MSPDVASFLGLLATALAAAGSMVISKRAERGALSPTSPVWEKVNRLRRLYFQEHEVLTPRSADAWNHIEAPCGVCTHLRVTERRRFYNERITEIEKSLR